ncbi:MAG: signal recognition particle protein, partial [Limnochordia bacterium]
KLTEKDVDAALREVRLALLEADVNFRVVKDFVARVKERALGQEVLSSLTPGQQVIKIVHNELTELLGGQATKLTLSSTPPTVIMMVGLQGSGKTTTSAKLALMLKKRGHRPLLAAADVYRPAAIKQLQVLGESIDTPVFSMGDRQSPVDIAKGALSHGRSHGNDVIILDTAGRLHVDEVLMEELVQIQGAVTPQEILLVVDSMTGQDAVNVAEEFQAQLPLTGLVLTKLDGDARGGAALSITKVTGQPIKFAALGEKLEDLEVFHPDRMASRILGMGDVLTLIEKASQVLDESKVKDLGQRLTTAQFTFEDFLDQLDQIKKMGPLDQILGMLPGFGGAKGLQGLQVDDRQLKRVEAIINSMTPQERRQPALIKGSRRKRIALGSGTSVQDVNQLLKQFNQTKELMRKLGGGKQRGKGRIPRGLKGLFGG